MCQPIVTVEGLSYVYPNGTAALRDVRFRLHERECIGLVGPNGAGKSTLLLHLAGLLPDSLPRGKSAIVLAGLPLIEKHAREARRSVGLLFQDPDDQLFCMNVLADVAYGPRSLGMSLPLARDAALKSLVEVGCEHLAERSPAQLSVGEKRLVGLAGVLACSPRLLAFDEPTSHLDPRGRRKFIDAIRRLDVAKMIASHDLEMVLELCSRTLVLDRGSIAAEGPTRELLADRELMESHGLETPASIRYAC